MNELNKLVQKGILKWHPYIGELYFSTAPRTLIIGESHYYANEKDKKAHQNENFTKEQFEKNIESSKVKFYKNLNLVLPSLGKCDSLDSKTNSKYLAFYNFIQKEMNTNKKRPSKLNFIKGYETLFELIEVLKPNRIIFFSITSGNLYKNHAKKIALEHGWKQLSHTRSLRISRNRSREIILENKDNKLELYFIKHPSSFFSISKWKNYLNLKINQQ